MSNTPDSSRPESDRLLSSRLDQDSLRIEVIVDGNVTPPLDESGLQRAVLLAAADRGYDRGEIALRVTTDTVIHQINREHLHHDFPTDVISFPYLADKPNIEGELVVSIDTARQSAAELGWSTARELALYAVHGTLHLTGMDDQDEADRARMREAERRVMLRLGIDDIDRFGADQVGSSVQQAHPSDAQAREGKA